MRYLWGCMRGFRRPYALAILLMTGATSLLFLLPLIYGFTIDHVIGEKPLQSPLAARWFEAAGGREALRGQLWLAGVVLVLTTLVSGSMAFGRSKLITDATEGFSRALRMRLYRHIDRLPVQYHITTDTGDLVQRCTSDVDTIRRFLSGQVVEMGRAAVMLVLAVPVVAMLDLRMMVASLCMMPILIIGSAAGVAAMGLETGQTALPAHRADARNALMWGDLWGEMKRLRNRWSRSLFS